MLRGDLIDVVGFDADDTLWECQDAFDAAEALFFDIVSPYASQGVDLADALLSTELGNLAISGYGVKAFGLSMIEAAVTATGGTIPSSAIGVLVDHVHDMLREPVKLLDGVADALQSVAQTHRIVMITKGDLVHQTRKVRTSGLAHHFEHIKIVLEKDVKTYQEVLDEWNINPSRFLMVGNSVRSDVIPVLEIGGFGLHIPYHVTWDHEVVDTISHAFDSLDSISMVANWLANEVN
ncbi:MAG: HAD family hydrolase [Ilumatobacteraceae bacterium]